MLTDWAIKKLQHLTLDYMTITCAGHDCYGYYYDAEDDEGTGGHVNIIAETTKQGP